MTNFSSAWESFLYVEKWPPVIILRGLLSSLHRRKTRMVVVYTIVVIVPRGVFRRTLVLPRVHINFIYKNWERERERERERDNPILYPNVFRCMEIILCMPVSSALAERSFSGMRRLKTYLRSTMRSERLSSLALLHIYRNDFSVDLDKVIYPSPGKSGVCPFFFWLSIKLIETDSSCGICGNINKVF